MKIAIVEDTQEQALKAKGILEAAGHEVVVYSSFSYLSQKTVGIDYQSVTVNALNEVDGVITDLHFNPLLPDRCSHPQFPAYQQNMPPAGLLVVIDALAVGKPVVICTDGNHHGEQLAWIYDGWLGRHGSKDRIVHWNDKKEWDMALRLLEMMVQRY